jgi:lipid-A-disaccharide synthase
LRVLVSVGEASGDAHAAKVVRHLRSRGAEVVAVGGRELGRAGAELLRSIDELSVLGFVEVARRLPQFWALKRQLDALLQSGSFDLFLPVDFPGLNLRLAASARRAGVPVLYYIGPQVWAWRAGRLRRMRRNVDHVALILPFEKAQYDAEGITSTFVGHPLLDDPLADSVEPEVDLGLFPGSRRQEVVRHLPTLLRATRRVRNRLPHLRVLVSCASTAPTDWMRATLQEHGFDPGSVLVDAPAREVMPRARALLVASGTATLEAALAGRPFAVVYRTGRLNYAVARRLVQLPHVSLANLVAGKQVVREYVQDALDDAAMAREIDMLLHDAADRERILQGLKDVRRRLGTPGAARRVADLAEHLGGRRAASEAAIQ